MIVFVICNAFVDKGTTQGSFMMSADCEVLCLNYSCAHRVQEITRIRTISDTSKNVEGYFFQTICCCSCLYKSQFQEERM
jgi:hypothetical protein